MNDTTVTTPNALEIRVERIFDAPRAHVFSVWTDPKLIPDWWGDGTVVEEMVPPALDGAVAPPRVVAVGPASDVVVDRSCRTASRDGVDEPHAMASVPAQSSAPTRTVARWA